MQALEQLQDRNAAQALNESKVLTFGKASSTGSVVKTRARFIKGFLLAAQCKQIKDDLQSLSAPIVVWSSTASKNSTSSWSEEIQGRGKASWGFAALLGLKVDQHLFLLPISLTTSY